MSTPTVDDAAKVLADPSAYADDDRLHAALTHLRAHNPVAWVDNRPYRPFWAITKHADIMAIERDNELFISEPRPLLATAAADDLGKQQLEAGMGLRTLIHMDDPHHRKVRQIGADWFRPKAMRDLKVRVDELAKRYVDKMRDAGPECDFVTEIAVHFPLYVIMSLLGLPESDYGRMHALTQEMFGGDDDEYKRDGGSLEDQLAVLLDFFAYFTALTASRREQPTSDLASAIANGRIDGEPLSDVDTASYYVIVASAGHDTTKDAISGGLHALIENPGELDRLRNDPEFDGHCSGGDDPLVHSGQGIHAHRHRRHHGARRRHRQGRIGVSRLRIGQPRRGGLHRPVPLRREPRPEQARGVRVRRALLPGCRAGPDGDEQPLQRADPASGLHRTRRRAGAFRHHVRWRTQAPSDSLLTAVTPSGPGCFAKHFRKPSTAATAAA